MKLTGNAPTAPSYTAFDKLVTFAHDAFVIETSPRAHELCGTEIIHIATLDGEDLTNQAINFISYDPAQRSFSLFTDSADDIGIKTIIIRGKLASHPAINDQI